MGILDGLRPRDSHHSGEAPLCLRASVVSLLFIKPLHKALAW